MSIVQLPKAQTGIPEVDRHLALITDKLNPVLRTMALPGGFKWVEIPGTNGGPSTFALQYAGVSRIVFDSAGNLISGGRRAFGSTGQAAMTTSITSANGWTTMGGLTFSYTPNDVTKKVKALMTASAYVSVAATAIQFRILMDGVTVITGPYNWSISAANSHSQWASNSVLAAGVVPAGAHTMAFQIQVTTAGVTLTQDANDSFSIVMEEAG